MANPDYITNHQLLLLLSERLKSYRLAARMSQKEMAEQSGVGLATISHFEQGVKPNMTLGNFISLLRTLGMERRVARTPDASPRPKRNQQTDTQTREEETKMTITPPRPARGSGK